MPAQPNGIRCRSAPAQHCPAAAQIQFRALRPERRSKALFHVPSFPQRSLATQRSTGTTPTVQFGCGSVYYDAFPSLSAVWAPAYRFSTCTPISASPSPLDLAPLSDPISAQLFNLTGVLPSVV